MASRGPATGPGLGLSSGELPFPVMVIPTRNTLRLTPAKTSVAFSTQRITTNLLMPSLLGAIACPKVWRCCTDTGRSVRRQARDRGIWPRSSKSGARAAGRSAVASPLSDRSWIGYAADRDVGAGPQCIRPKAQQSLTAVGSPASSTAERRGPRRREGNPMGPPRAPGTGRGHGDGTISRPMRLFMFWNCAGINE
jgi:hypothetical protein